MILDSDCIFRKPIDNIFLDIEKNGIITYDNKYENSHIINGISTEQMRNLYKTYYDTFNDIDDLLYKGGEFIGINSSLIIDLLDKFELLWNINNEQYKENKLKLNDEAHFLSFLYYKMGYKNSHANKYIKRMWITIHDDNIEI